MGILDKIAAAGIVGCGGAGFPTHVKLKGSFEYLIVNGAECEPLLRTDRYLMRHKAADIVRAVAALGSELHIPNCVIALKEHYHEEEAALRAAIEASGVNVKLHLLESFYPAGDEQTIVHEVTGRVVPPAGLPSAAGAVVQNIATVYAISQAMNDAPFTHKYLTVTGEVKAPTVLCVPIGTSFSECIALAGGTKKKEYFAVAGGPMMGRPVPFSEVERSVVTKTTSGILVLPADGYHAKSYATDVRRMLNRAKSACIQCSFCSQLCPRHMLGHPLEPHRIMRKMAMAGNISDMLDDPVIRSAQLCCECGVCETYACPMGLFPRKINALIKGEMAKAGVRYSVPSREWVPSPYREERKVPSEKAAARAGVHKYYNYDIPNLRDYEPSRVEIPTKMHIGAPAVACVRVGDKVRVGDCIATPAEGALGAAIHASISGRVAAAGERIVIEKE